MLSAIRSATDQLRRAELAVARVVLAAPASVLNDSIAQLAARAGVSEPTVLRFCRAVGFTGFQDFKLKLAQDLAATAARAEATRESVALARDLSPDDSVGSAAEKVLNRAIDALLRVRDGLDATALERAARAMIGARRVEIFGVGASGSVAQDAHHKMFRLLPAVSASSDPHIQAMAAATLGPGDVAVALSKTGTSVEILNAVAVARSAGATVVAITAPGSDLARAADIVLAVEVDEDTAIHTPMASRLAQLAVLDALAVGIGLLSPPDLNERLGRIKAVLRERHLTSTGAAVSPTPLVPLSYEDHR
ncbi:MurR/RpiR family transcriptional regulator [Azospirillum thermophilum]|uniref:MurR/RpiR family transcriptional regulator n=1 Tax=Azospirillum thermophilum TaxID=2202148 RepID=A0A2S2CX27_9PROT|nr:SIS domain-containing protein [Azospirillum thermophilum]AWK89041.1 MurR/RpiR family transcriptional regulator [Azospirillum thermophilum]